MIVISQVSVGQCGSLLEGANLSCFLQESKSIVDLILISLDNKPGALSKVLKVFESSKINLSHIQSRPNKSDKWQYSFFLDFEGHLDDVKVKSLMKKLSSVTQSLKFLGSYPKSF